jgi:hypothetical protein
MNIIPAYVLMVFFFSFQAIDVWMGVCTAFVFAALVEFTFVNYLWRKTAAKKYLASSAHHYTSKQDVMNGARNGGEERGKTNNGAEGVELNLVSL